MELHVRPERLMERWEAFHKAETGVLIQIKDIISLPRTVHRPLNQWRFPGELHTYLDTMVTQLEEHWRQRAGIDDDLIPALSPWFGIAEHSAILGGDVIFTPGTSHQIPFLTDWGMLEEIELSEDNSWFRMIVDGISYLKEKSAGRYAVRLRGADGPMDMANAMRGSDFFTDMIDYPEETHRLLDLCVRAMQWSFDHQMRVAGTLSGGFLTGMDIWLPGRSCGHISEDASTMCSAGFYEEYGRPYTERFCGDFDNVLIHIHGLGIRLLPAVASIPHTGCIQISNDPNCGRSIDLYREYAEHLVGKTVLLDMTRAEIERNIDFLARNKAVVQYTAATPEDARAMVGLVRSYMV